MENNIITNTNSNNINLENKILVNEISKMLHRFRLQPMIDTMVAEIAAMNSDGDKYTKGLVETFENAKNQYGDDVTPGELYHWNIIYSSRILFKKDI